MYIVEGNIGAGKSTFLKLITQFLSDVSVELEPMHNWQGKVFGQSLLANFYQQPKRWSYTMETFAMMCRVKEHIKEQERAQHNRLFERSIYSGHYVFSHNGYQTGLMSDLEWELYSSWFNFLIPNKCTPPLGFIYLQTNPEVAYKRIKKRNRYAEKKITFAYLKAIHEHHENFLIKKENLLPELVNVPVLVLDCNEEFEEDTNIMQQHCQKIADFLLSTQPTKTTCCPTISAPISSE